ncbi:MAG: glycoside hydrolase family 2 TIM barrel-domain containing protein [Kiritimatiellia bacterium]
METANRTMKFARFAATVVAAAFALAADAESKIWNRAWEFKRGDMQEWQPCHLPHSFSAPYFLGKEFYTGTGVYRKRLTAAETSAEHLFLDFEGAFQYAEVRLDGKLMGTHANGYTGFRIDLTPGLKRGERQLVEVKVSNEWDKFICPRAGEHQFSGGIYRNVRLTSEGKSWIDFNGLTVTTPEVSATEAKAVFAVKLGGEKEAEITYEFNGEKIVTKATEVEFKVAQPRLWSPESPALYPVRVTVGRSVATANVGFRWFRFTKDEGFFLNGKHRFFLGANVHQDAAGWVDGVTDTSAARDVRLMKEAGFDFIRGSHYPHSKAFIDACDREGILFWSEGGVWGTGWKKEDGWWSASAVPHNAADAAVFAKNAETLTREMIMDAKNHPAVIVWSVSNEPFFVANGEEREMAKQICRRLLEVVRATDPTRPAAIGGAQRGGFDLLGADVIGYNGDGALLFRDPPGPSVVSEYGSPKQIRPGKYQPFWGEFGNDRPAWRSGAAIWCGFDHGSIHGDGSIMGIVDYFRLPKATWFWYRNHLRGIPPPEATKAGEAARIVLATDRPVMDACDGTQDAHVTVTMVDKDGKCVNDNRRVVLTVVSGPGEFPTGREIAFAQGSGIDIYDGKAAIAMRANFAGVTKLVAKADGLPAAELEIVTQRGDCTDADVDWVEGVSARTPDRPYAGPYRKPAKAGGQAAALCNVAPDHPIAASSNAVDGKFASDGDLATSWKPAGDDHSPWFVLNLEFSMQFRQIETVGEGIEKIELSSDGEAWAPYDERHAANAQYIRVRIAQGGRLDEIKVLQ